ncbi:MAG: DUF1284 domain-containing protein [Gammaproteobacteria bacterium]|nr:DUF1284 domain-containing protein [Gammaproteobacteria bacterium]
MEITFRPHHFLCTLCFQGAGYSPSFIRNFKRIVEILNANENTEIKIVSHTDSICAPCPHRRELLCTSQDKISTLDQAHAAAIHVQPNTTITWKNAKENISKHLTLEKFHTICASCEWKKYGMCEGVLKKAIG